LKILNNRKEKKMNEKAINLIYGLSSFTVFIGEGRKVITRNYRLKSRGTAIESADGKDKSVDGFIDTDVYPPILRLTKLRGCNVDFQVEIPENGKMVTLDTERKMKVRFYFQ